MQWQQKKCLPWTKKRNNVQWNNNNNLKKQHLGEKILRCYHCVRISKIEMVYCSNVLFWITNDYKYTSGLVVCYYNVKVIPITNFSSIYHFQTTYKMRRIFVCYICTFLSNQNDRDFGNDFDKYLKVPLIKYKCTVRDVFCFKWYVVWIWKKNMTIFHEIGYCFVRYSDFTKFFVIYQK